MLGRRLQPLLMLCQQLAHGVSLVAVQACHMRILLPQAAAQGVLISGRVAVMKGPLLMLCRAAQDGSTSWQAGAGAHTCMRI